MLAEERRQRILDTLVKDGRIVAKELADQFELSIDSIRRDLTIMEQQGLLQKNIRRRHYIAFSAEGSHAGSAAFHSL